MKALSWIIRKIKANKNQKQDFNQFWNDLNFIKSFAPIPSITNKILIIKLDDIGDYILFRNCLHKLKISASMVSKNINLIGNIIWKPIFDEFDKGTVDNVIWVDKSRWKDQNYRFEIYQLVHNEAFETVYYPSVTRRLLLDELISHASNAANIYTRSINQIGGKWESEAYLTLKNQIIPLSKYTEFEFANNMYFFEILLAENWTDTVPSFNLKPTKLKRIGIFPGAAHKSKRWGATKFRSLIMNIIKEIPEYEIILLGAKSDVKRAKLILKDLIKTDKIINLTGDTSLVELIHEIAKCELLITNDTSALHIASALNIKVIALSNGVNYQRFIEYPEKRVTAIYPPSFIKALNENNSMAISKTVAYSNEIQSIKVKTVFTALSKQLSTKSNTFIEQK